VVEHGILGGGAFVLFATYLIGSFVQTRMNRKLPLDETCDKDTALHGPHLDCGDHARPPRMDGSHH